MGTEDHGPESRDDNPPRPDPRVDQALEPGGLESPFPFKTKLTGFSVEGRLEALEPRVQDLEARLDLAELETRARRRGLWLPPGDLPIAQPEAGPRPGPTFANELKVFSRRALLADDPPAPFDLASSWSRSGL